MAGGERPIAEILGWTPGPAGHRPDDNPTEPTVDDMLHWLTADERVVEAIHVGRLNVNGPFRAQVVLRSGYYEVDGEPRWSHSERSFTTGASLHAAVEAAVRVVAGLREETRD